VVFLQGNCSESSSEIRAAVLSSRLRLRFREIFVLNFNTTLIPVIESHLGSSIEEGSLTQEIAAEPMRVGGTPPQAHIQISGQERGMLNLETWQTKRR